MIAQWLRKYRAGRRARQLGKLLAEICLINPSLNQQAWYALQNLERETFGDLLTFTGHPWSRHPEQGAQSREERG